jgi:hypothetical protein
MKIGEIFGRFDGQPLTRQVLQDLLKDYRRPYDKISEMVRHQELIPVKRGIFVPGPRLHISQPHPFLLANHLAGPSYVSLETALSHWRLIPEKVFETASATTGRSKSFRTQLGRFSYMHLPLPYFAFGQLRIELHEKQAALIAAPEKALCDKIIATSGLNFRSGAQVLEWLTEDMRMEKESLKKLDIDLIDSWLIDSPKSSSLMQLVKALKGV